MKTLLYILLLIGTLLMGILDNGNITAFVILLMFGACKATENIISRRNGK